VVPSLAVHVGHDAPWSASHLTPPSLPHAYHSTTPPLPAINAVHMRRLKSAYHPPSPPPQHAEFSYCWLLLAIADHTHSSLPPPRHQKLARCLQASPTAAIYTHTSARRARAARNQNSGCWRARGPGKEQGRGIVDGVLLLPGGAAADGAEQQAGGGDLLALRRVRQRGGHGDRHQGLLPAHRAPPHLARHHLHLLRRHAQVLPPLQALLTLGRSMELFESVGGGGTRAFILRGPRGLL
jgi:hypothetical protein